jgi:glycosyltransferase involved in cell wall biosynthesis
MFLDVSHFPLDEQRLRGRSIDVPKTGNRAGAAAVDVIGWVLGRSSPAVAVEIMHGDTVLRRSPVGVRRSDIAAHFDGVLGADAAGFQTTLNLSGTRDLELTVRAVLRDQTRVPIGVIRSQGYWRGAEGPEAAPLVSVVIPCFNQAHFLTEAIESVFGQTHPHVEVVVVDDGSTDNTAEIAARYPGVRCVRQENRGLAGARNTGLSRTNGEYLVFLDSDDRLLPNAIRLGLEALAARPECAFVSGQIRVIALDGGILWEWQPQPRERDSYAALLRRNYIATPAVVLFRRAAFEAVGVFDIAVHACADYELYLRISRTYPVCSHDQVVIDYRLHGGNMSRNPELMLEMLLKVLRAQRPYVRRNPRLRAAYREGLRVARGEFGGRLVQAVRDRVSERRWGAAAGGLSALARHYPLGLAALFSGRAIESTRANRIERRWESSGSPTGGESRTRRE